MGNFALQYIMLLLVALLKCSVTAQTTQRMIDVRLAGGSNGSSGIVELRSLIPLTGWQDFFCGYSSFSTRVSAVVCRMLGFETIASYSSTRVNMNGNFLSPPFCNGDEMSINECNGSYHFTTHCDYRYEITCSTCEIGAVRLTNGLVPEQGIVEICLNGSWFRVCYYGNWGYQNSLVVCRQLGYPATKAEYTNSSTYTGLHTGYILSSLMYNCVGDENSLYNCTSGTSSTCDYYNSIGYSSYVIVLCRGEIAMNCTDGAIRLAGGRDQYEGRVEVCCNRLWGTLSRYGWDSNDATVACRQLGLLQPHLLTRVTMSSFGPGEGAIFFHKLKCNGSENSLNHCQRTTTDYYYYFYHSNDAGVRCQFNPSSVYTNCNNDIRLVGGNSVSEGRVEICFNGVWGSICNYGWNNIDATVVCRKLGFQAENSTAINDLRYGEGSGPYLLYDVYCRGHERNLTECQYGNSQIGYHVCSPKQDAGVICDASTCHHGDIRLFGGYSKSYGIAEICINGQWTSICYQGWDEIDSIKFCRQLLGRDNVVAPYSTCCSKIRSTSVAAVNNVRCNASPSTRLVNCNYEQGYNPFCSLIVGCYVNDSCNYGSVRLVNGRTRNEGIVEVCLNGMWSTIKSYRWNTLDAEVVCRQLGMPWEWSQYYDVGLRDDTHYSPSLLQDVNCVGDEDMLLNCTHREVSLSQSLRYYSIAAVLCQGSTNQSNNPNECISGEVRLGNSSNNIEGRVEICTEGMWVSVCDRYWGIVETRAFCKQLLGNPAKGSFHITNGYYGTGNHPIISQVSCHNSDSFNSCRIAHQGYCSHGEDVGVVCQESYHAITVTSITEPPFELGSIVKLHCSINHDPSVGRPVRLQYSWRGNDGKFSYSSFSPNMTELIPVTHYKTSYYYCEVSVSNFVIGVGSILIKTKDIINPIDVPPSQSYEYHFALAVNVSDQIQSIVRELNWYFNGNLITNFYNIELTNGNKTLMTTVGNPGVYEVRYDGLLALPHNRECESILLSVMRHYPMFKPVRFYVNTTEELYPQTSTIMTLWRNSAEDVVFTDGDNITLTAVGQTHLFVEQRDHITIKWFVNGRREYSSYYYDNIHGYAQFSSNYRLTNTAYQSSGIYETLLVWNINTYAYYHNCYPYYYSLRREPLFDLYEVILAKSSIELKYYESLNHSFSTTKSSLSSSEVSLLTCSATIHYPPLTSISIVKNEIILKTAVNTTLTVSTNRLGVSPFGSYQCRVNASGVPFTQKLMIKERVSLRIELQIEQPLKCSRDNDFVEVMKSNIATKLNDGCSCNVTITDLRDTQIVCNSESNIIFTTLLVFSTERGDETASTLANRLSGQVSFSALTIDINGSEALITTAVITSSTAGRNSDSVGTNIGVFIGGVIFSAVFIALFIIIIMICRRKSFKNSNPPATIAMSENACYSSEKSEVRVNLKDDSKDMQDAVYEEISTKNDDD